MKNLLQITFWTTRGFEGSKPIHQALEDAKARRHEGLELAFGMKVLGTETIEPDCRPAR